jgi:hypothetical protein
MRKIIAYSSGMNNGKVTVFNSEDDTITSSNPYEILHFINDDYSDDNIHPLKVTWNIDGFVSSIIRLFGIGIARQLASTQHEYHWQTKIKGDIVDNFIWYLPSKLFIISETIYNPIYNKVMEVKSYLYHLEQYFEDEPDPIDPITIQSKTQDLINAFHQMGINPYKLTSPVAIYEKEVLDHMKVDTVLDLPRTKDADILIDYAEATIGRLWIENMAIGHWNVNENYSYDLQSCFPYHASKLYSIKYAQITRTNNIVLDSQYAWMRGKITIKDDVKISPIIHKDSQGNMTTPTGTWEDIITYDEYAFLYKYNIGRFEIEDAFWLKVKAPVQPMELPMQRLFNLRNKGGLVKMLAKKMAVGGSYGKMIQQNDNGQAGKYYNPLWASYVSTRARIQVAGFIYDNNLQDSILHIGVDGFISSNKVKSFKNIVGMGNWKLNDPSPCLILSPGRIYHGDKKPSGLTYEAIMNMIKDKPRETYYKTILNRRQTLKESVENDNLQGVGEYKDFHSSLDLNLIKTSQDRKFKSFPNNGADLLSNKYYGEPIHVES